MGIVDSYLLSEKEFDDTEPWDIGDADPPVSINSLIKNFVGTHHDWVIDGVMLARLDPESDRPIWYWSIYAKDPQGRSRLIIFDIEGRRLESRKANAQND